MNKFVELGVELPINIMELSEEKQNDILNYLKTLDKIQIKALCIAVEHLESSFNIFKSIGFDKWKKNN